MPYQRSIHWKRSFVYARYSEWNNPRLGVYLYIILFKKRLSYFCPQQAKEKQKKDFPENGNREHGDYRIHRDTEWRRSQTQEYS